MDEYTLEQKIGSRSGNGNLTLANVLARLQNPNYTYETQSALKLWCIHNGIPVSITQKMKQESLAKCYSLPAYLKKVRQEHNPNWKPSYNNGDDLNFDEDDDDDEFAKVQSVPTPTLENGHGQQNPDKDDILKSVRTILNHFMENELRTKIQNTRLELSPEAKEQIQILGRESAREMIETLMPPREIVVKRPEINHAVNVGRQHKMFETLLKCCTAVDHKGYHLNIWITGPTGSGKTTAAEYVAKALGLEFGFDSSLDNDYKVNGFIDANGHFISTAFIERYKNGGIYVMDEVDNWMPSALLSANAPLANGMMSTPNGVIPRHKDCIIIACANTWGLGATNDYVGRTKLDAATLDRFMPKIDWPYDPDLEMAIAKDIGGEIGEEWCTKVQYARLRAKNQGLKIIVSPRATYNGIGLIKAGFTLTDAAEMTFLAGLSKEQKQTVGY